MDPTIKEVVQGAEPTLLHTEKANELIRKLNSILTLEVSPQGFGKLTLGDRNAKLDLTPIRDLINQLQTTVAAFSQANGGGGAAGGGGGGSGGSSDWRTPYNNLLFALSASTLQAACDPVTRDVTVTWVIDLPPVQ